MKLPTKKVEGKKDDKKIYTSLKDIPLAEYVDVEINHETQKKIIRQIKLNFDEIPKYPRNATPKEQRKYIEKWVKQGPYREFKLKAPNGKDYIKYSGTVLLNYSFFEITLENYQSYPEKINWKTALLNPPVKNMPYRNEAIIILIFSIFIITLPMCFMIAYVKMAESARIYSMHIQRIKGYRRTLQINRKILKLYDSSVNDVPINKSRKKSNVLQNNINLLVDKKIVTNYPLNSSAVIDESVSNNEDFSFSSLFGDTDKNNNNKNEIVNFNSNLLEKGIGYSSSQKLIPNMTPINTNLNIENVLSAININNQSQESHKDQPIINGKPNSGSFNNYNLTSSRIFEKSILNNYLPNTNIEKSIKSIFDNSQFVSDDDKKYLSSENDKSTTSMSTAKVKDLLAFDFIKDASENENDFNNSVISNKDNTRSVNNMTKSNGIKSIIDPTLFISI